MPPLAIYIHWPFCKSKCPYCDFNSHVREKIDSSIWKNALLTDLEYAASLTKNHRACSIFFGGGTPSLMPPDIPYALIERVKELWQCEDNLEITLEANPSSVEADNFCSLNQAGVNRISIGVQSLRSKALKFLGREHSTEEALYAIETASRYFARYSFDLIYARPEQTIKDWQEELEAALKLTRGHISLYQLTIEENTAFHTAYKKGAFVMPDEETAALMYEITERLTKQKGFISYEVSNYAILGEESRHNLAYWKGYDYVGIGPGAHGRIRTKNSSDNYSSEQITIQRNATISFKSPERWLEAVINNGNGIESNIVLSERNCAEERLIMGMRLTEGLPLAEVQNYLNEEKIQFAIKQNLLVDNDKQLIATPKGRLVLTTLISIILKDNV